MKNKLSLGLITLLLSGCATTYVPQSQTSKVNVSELSSPQILVGTQWQTLQVNPNGNAAISTNHRVVIRSTQTYSGYNSETSCYPTSSFIPREDKQYYVNFVTKGNHCELSILQKSRQTKLGLIKEPSAVSYGDTLNTTQNIPYTYIDPVVKK